MAALHGSAKMYLGDRYSKWLAVSVVAVSFAVYLKTLCPTVYSFDSAELTAAAYFLGIAHASGYPLYLLLAKLFTYLPVANVAYRVNLMSAVFASLNVLVVYQIIVKLTDRKLPALVAALAFAFSYYFWGQAVVAEVYTLHTFLISAMTLTLLRWQETREKSSLYLFSLAYGLSLANHISSILFLPAIVYLLLVTYHQTILRPSSVLAMLLLSCSGLLFYLYLPLRYVADPPIK